MIYESTIRGSLARGGRRGKCNLILFFSNTKKGKELRRIRWSNESILNSLTSNAHSTHPQTALTKRLSFVSTLTRLSHHADAIYNSFKANSSIDCFSFKASTQRRNHTHTPPPLEVRLGKPMQGRYKCKEQINKNEVGGGGVKSTQPPRTIHPRVSVGAAGT